MDAWLRSPQKKNLKPHKEIVFETQDHPMVSCWTRNFYELDAVADSLATAILNKHPLRRQHALFWAHELWVSEEWDLLYKTLTKAFLNYPPVPGLISAWEQYTENPQCEETALRFMSVLLDYPVQILESARTPDINCPAISDTQVLKRAVTNAESNNQGVRLFLLLGTLPAKEAAALLSAKTTKKVNQKLLQLWKQNNRGLPLVLANAGMTWCSEQYEQHASHINNQWPQRNVGMLAARLFRTTRRKIPMTPSAVGILTGCAAWQRILVENRIDRNACEEAGDLVFEDDESCEAFYQTYFPEDIPDEWTAEEKAKSHAI